MKHLSRVALSLLLLNFTDRSLAGATPDIAPIRLEIVRHEERIMTEVEINGQTTRLVLDTGGGGPFVVFAPVAARLHLQVAAAPAGTPHEGRIALRLTNPCDIRWLENTIKEVSPGVVPLPAFVADVGFDGVIGWPAFGENLWLFQIANADAPVVPLLEFPTAPGALQLTVADDDTLVLNFAPNPSDGPKLLVDTGNAGGVVLSPARWRESRTTHPRAPVTVQTAYMPAEGYRAAEIAWADEISVGPLVLRQVPVTQAGATYLQHAHDGQEIVALGLYALKQLDLVVDGRTKRALILPRDPGPLTSFSHNRISAAFLPATGPDLKLVAHVLPLSPAAEADVCTGDLLVTVNGQAAADWWNGDPGSFREPAGTEFHLVLLRDARQIQRRVVARDILKPSHQDADEGDVRRQSAHAETRQQQKPTND